MSINIKLLDRAIAHVEAHPEQWDQGSWCGTSQCIAGWICSLSGVEHDESNTPQLACGLLGLGTGTSPPMFSAGNNLTALKLWRTILAGEPLPDLSDADLRGANLSDADLSDANLRGANLSDADLSDANLRDADLRGADLSDADLRDADLSDADLSDANLSDADLRDTDLRGANLRGADLRDTDLRCADLRRTDLRGANLSDADLRCANLSDADLTDVIGFNH